MGSNFVFKTGFFAAKRRKMNLKFMKFGQFYYSFQQSSCLIVLNYPKIGNYTELAKITEKGGISPAFILFTSWLSNH